MQDNQSSNKINPIAVVAVLLQTLFTILAVVSIVNLTRPSDPAQPQIKVDGYSDLTDRDPDSSANSTNSDTTTVDFGNATGLDDAQKRVVEGILYDIAASNYSGNIKNFGAKIRANSVINLYLNEFSAHYVSFLVDLESLAQSYRVVYRWADQYPNDVVPPNRSAMIFCPRESDLIYGDFDCHDDYDGLAEDQVVYELVRYKMFDNFTVGILSDPYKGERLSFHINTISDDKAVTQAAVSELSDYLTSLGFDLENYDYAAGIAECCSL